MAKLISIILAASLMITPAHATEAPKQKCNEAFIGELWMVFVSITAIYYIARSVYLREKWEDAKKQLEDAKKKHPDNACRI